MRLVRRDQFRDCPIVDQNFDNRASAATIRCLDQHLRHDGLQTHGEKRFGLFAQFAGQGINDSIDRLYGARRMQCAKYEVTGFGRHHCHRNGLSVAQLTDENDVRILTHRGTYTVGERRNVRAQLALNDLALLARVNELNGVFEADDIQTAGLVEVINHRCKRG